MHNKKLQLKSNGSFELINDELSKIEESDLISVRPVKVGVCSSDIPRAFSNKSYFYPLVLGHEFCVIVNNDNKRQLKMGQRCVVFPLLPCFKCSSCREKKYNMCKNYSYYGSRTDGGLQKNLKVKRWNLIPIPDIIDNVSACLLEPISVCVHAVKKLKNNQKVLIYGGGFLAQIISQLLLAKNSKVFCLDRNEFKKSFFNKEVFFTTDKDSLEESSFDAVIECCGANDILSKCIAYGKPGATILQMANPSSGTKLDSNGISSLMRKEQQILGTWNSEYRPDNPKKCDWHKTISLLSSKKLFVKNLISHEANLNEASDLFYNIYARKNKNSKIINFNKAVINVL